MNEAAATIRTALGGRRPKLAMVLGSGLGGLTEALQERVELAFSDIPGFPEGGVSGHAGRLIAGRLSGRDVIAVSGRSHYYERGDAAAMRPVIAALKEVGVTALLLTNSAGSVRQDMPPGSVMMIEDHIAFSGMNPLIGEGGDDRFVGMTVAYDRGLRAAFAEAAAQCGETLFGGVYMWFSGPSFETPAEIRMARMLGADAVGMSTVPETILSRFYGLKVCAASVITNYGAGMTGDELGHEETKRMAPLGGERLGRIVTAAIANGGFDE